MEESTLQPNLPGKKRDQKEVSKKRKRMPAQSEGRIDWFFKKIDTKRNVPCAGNPASNE